MLIAACRSAALQHSGEEFKFDGEVPWRGGDKKALKIPSTYPGNNISFNVDQYCSTAQPYFVCLEKYRFESKGTFGKMAEETENRVEPTAQPEDKIVSVSQVEENTAANVVKVDSYRDDHHINLTWRSWMVVL